jgi:hypothetical protein
MAMRASARASSTRSLSARPGPRGGCARTPAAGTRSRQAAGSPVVDLGGDPAPLVLLDLDGPADERFQGAFLVGELPEQARVVDRLGDQRRRQAQKVDVASAELAPLPVWTLNTPTSASERDTTGTDSIEVNCSPPSSGMYL